MDKKDIYEHLAKIYLDASLKRKKKRDPAFFKGIIIASIFLVAGITSFFAYNLLNKNRNLSSEIALVLAPDPIKINFNFDPAKKEVYSLNLNKLDLNKFKSLGFSVKKVDYNDTISLRIEFINAFKEKSEVYIKNVPHKWKEYKIDFSEFKGINDWSSMVNLAFVVEEWNTRQKHNVVYVDNIRLVR